MRIAGGLLPTCYDLNYFFGERPLITLNPIFVIQEVYLFNAALSELKTEFQVKSRNDGIQLKSMTSSLQRDTDSIGQRLKEDMIGLKSDIQVRLFPYFC